MYKIQNFNISTEVEAACIWHLFVIKLIGLCFYGTNYAHTVSCYGIEAFLELLSPETNHPFV